jgi:hypothetical protein
MARRTEGDNCDKEHKHDAEGATERLETLALLLAVLPLPPSFHRHTRVAQTRVGVLEHCPSATVRCHGQQLSQQYAHTSKAQRRNATWPGDVVNSASFGALLE